MTVHDPRPRSLVWASDHAVLGLDRIIERRDGYTVVRSPSNPTFHWGNLLLFDDPPAAGDGERWEEIFAAEFAAEPRVRHMTFAWDRTDGAQGAAVAEFGARGFQLEESVGLIARADELRPHRRANPEVRIHHLDPALGQDEELWRAVIELQVANRDPVHTEAGHRAFSTDWLGAHRERFRRGQGTWSLAITPNGEIAASCGVVVLDGLARYQAVDTLEQFRRQGIASRLLADAGRNAIDRFGAERFVIVADANYHALGLYESLGFSRLERVFGVVRGPAAAAGHTPS